MNKDQIDLFGSAPAVPAARVASPQIEETIVVVFPLGRRGKLVRTAAATLMKRKTQEGQQSYWNRVIHRLRDVLRQLGCSQAEADRQIANFYRSVEVELDRLHHSSGGDRRGDGGDGNVIQFPTAAGGGR